MAKEQFKHHEFEIMQDSWKVYTKYYDGSDADDDEFWDKCVHEFLEVMARYSNSKFATDVVNAFLQDIERRSK